MIKQIGKISPNVHRCTKAVVSPNGENYRHGSSSTQCGQTIPKGQLISKANWRAIDSPKKQTDKLVLFAFSLFTANKSNSSIRFLGESTAR